ncbi:MAG: hypothetical protein AB1758_38075 [Candidatus Eremiobacterota bacterium]
MTDEELEATWSPIDASGAFANDLPNHQQPGVFFRRRLRPPAIHDHVLTSLANRQLHRQVVESPRLR